MPAQYSGADRVVTGAGEKAVIDLAAEIGGRRPDLRFDPDDLDTHPFPALDLQCRIPFAPLLTVRGCPYRCAYCAASRLAPVRRRQSVARVLAEIEHWHTRFGVRDFAFYDDALLVDPETVMPGRFSSTSPPPGTDLRLHTPNALHIRCIDLPLARAMRRAGMQTVRLGLETTDFEARKGLDAKVTAEEFKRAAACLREAGFSATASSGPTCWRGCPVSPWPPWRRPCARCARPGSPRFPPHYSPIPGTPLWPTARAASRYDLEADPVFTNNAVWPCRPRGVRLAGPEPAQAALRVTVGMGGHGDAGTRGWGDTVTRGHGDGASVPSSCRSDEPAPHAVIPRILRRGIRSAQGLFI